MARQFVGFDSLFDELNALADRKESNYPAYNIAKDDEEHYGLNWHLQVSAPTKSSYRPKRVF